MGTLDLSGCFSLRVVETHELFSSSSLIAAEVGAGSHGGLAKEDKPAGHPFCWKDQSQLSPLRLELQQHTLSAHTNAFTPTCVHIDMSLHTSIVF